MPHSELGVLKITSEFSGISELKKSHEIRVSVKHKELQWFLCVKVQTCIKETMHG